MKEPICPRHHLPRPCPRCAQLRWGGSRGGGRRARFRDPVRVSLTLEREQLAALAERWPDATPAQALQLAVRESASPETRAAMDRDLETLAPWLAVIERATAEQLEPAAVSAELEILALERRLGPLSPSERDTVRAQAREPVPCEALAEALAQLPEISCWDPPSREIDALPPQPVTLTYWQAQQLMNAFGSALATWDPAPFRAPPALALAARARALRLPQVPPADASVDASISFELGAGECYLLYGAVRRYLLAAPERLERAWIDRFLERARAGDEQGLAIFRRWFFDPAERRLLEALRQIPRPWEKAATTQGRSTSPAAQLDLDFSTVTKMAP